MYIHAMHTYIHTYSNEGLAIEEDGSSGSNPEDKEPKSRMFKRDFSRRDFSLLGDTNNESDSVSHFSGFYHSNSAGEW